jgi:TonB-dependent receptor
MKLSGFGAAIRAAALLLWLDGTAIGVQAQEATPGSPVVEEQAGEAQGLPTVVVHGDRQSLDSALDLKRARIGIVDSVLEDDIARLPDFNVAEALQRVPGIQIQRDLGEGTSPAIRGLTQMETLIDGREIFTAGTGRNLNFEDIPAELVAGIDVYKTSSAEQLEGGIGGSIDLRTHRPFDFSGPTAIGTARLMHAGLAQQTKPQASFLGADRWAVPGAGEVGVMLDVSYQARAFREDQKSEGNPLYTADVVPGQTILVPNGTSETTSMGTRTREAGDLMVQWRPSPSLEIRLQQELAQLRTLQDSYQINVTVPSAFTFVPGTPVLFPGTNDLESITWTDAPLSVLSFARDTLDRTRATAAGATWQAGEAKVDADLSYTKSYQSLYFCGPFLAGTAGTFSQNLSTALPATAIGGTDLLDPADLSYTGIAYRTWAYEGDETAARVDAKIPLNGPYFLQSVDSGLRLARRTASNAPGIVFGDTTLSPPISGASKPGFLVPDPVSPFPGVGPSSIAPFLVGNLAWARNAAWVRSAFGIDTPLPTSASPLSLWDIGEQTQAVYGLARLQDADAGLDGEAGLRLARTDERVSGSESVPATGSIAPLDIDTAYWDWLPSASARWRPLAGLALRAAASRTLTRPDFNELSPSLTLVPNPINPSLNQGAAGNPNLKPIRSDNLDLAIERDFDRESAISLTGFVKHVTGFLLTVASPEVHDGALYEVTRPENSTPATIKGFELAYQQFFGSLAAWLEGLGVQANYTYVDSESPNVLLGAPAPLQDLSRNSLNLIGMYERGPVSVRVAYNWRDDYLSSVINVVNVGALPVYMRPYGWVDASVRYRLTERITVTLDALNLTRTLRRSYYGVETRPQSAWLDDPQAALSLTVRL